MIAEPKPEREPKPEPEPEAVPEPAPKAKAKRAALVHQVKQNNLHKWMSENDSEFD